MKKSLAFSLLVCSFLLLNPSGLLAERILIPLSVADVRGANGSVFTSDMWVHNFGSVTAEFSTDEYCITLCPLPEIDPGASRPVRLNGQPASDPALIGYTSPTGSRFDYNLRIRDLSRQSQTWGTEVPVIPESQFITGVVNLLNVPTDDRFRVSLRVYTFDAPPTAARVRIWQQSANFRDPIAELTMPLRIGAGDSRYKPAYGEIHALAQTFSAIKIDNKVRVEIELPGTPFWAFASITNNETQHITLVTPQR